MPLFLVCLEKAFQVLEILVRNINRIHLKILVISPIERHKLTSNSRRLVKPVMGIFLF